MIGPTQFRVVRGDERLETSRISLKGKFCVVHGQTGRLVYVLADGERYLACEWCLSNSPNVLLDEAEMDLT
jgi:hypothetical protein